MNIEDLEERPLWQMTGKEFLFLHEQGESNHNLKNEVAENEIPKKYVYGILGIAKIFGCSMPTANRIKKSGKIDKAITQIGRKIIVNSELALELANRKVGGRR